MSRDVDLMKQMVLFKKLRKIYSNLQRQIFKICLYPCLNFTDFYSSSSLTFDFFPFGTFVSVVANEGVVFQKVVDYQRHLQSPYLSDREDPWSYVCCRHSLSRCSSIVRSSTQNTRGRSCSKTTPIRKKYAMPRPF